MDSKPHIGSAFDGEEREEESVLELHRAQLRERPEPDEGSEPVPWWLWAIATAAVFFGGFYLGRYGGEFTADAHGVPYRGSPWASQPRPKVMTAATSVVVPDS